MSNMVSQILHRTSWLGQVKIFFADFSLIQIADFLQKFKINVAQISTVQNGYDKL